MNYTVSPLRDNNEKVFAVQDIVSDYMFDVTDDGTGERAAFVYGEREAQRVARMLTDWASVRHMLEYKADVTVDDIREIMGMERNDV